MTASALSRFSTCSRCHELLGNPWSRRSPVCGTPRPVPLPPIPVFRPPGKPQPPGQVLVAPLELRRGELVKVAGFALQAAAAETERVAAKVQEGQGGTAHPLR